MRYVRLDQLADADLSDGEMIEALASGLAALSLLLHRTRLGGRLAESIEQQFDADGMVLVPVDDGSRAGDLATPATAIACRSCGAAPGEQCVTWRGSRIFATKRLHAFRLREWQAMQAFVSKAGTAEEGDPDGR
jgi:hypothetical protein